MKRSRAGLLVCLAVVLMLAGCVTPPRPSAVPPAAETVSIEAFSRNPFRSVQLPASRMHRHEEAIKALGPPERITTKDTENIHDPKAVDSLITLRYPFGSLMYLRVSGKDLENLILIQLQGNHVPLKYGIRFGQTTRTQILKLFGASQHAESNSESYDVRYTPEMTNSTTFYFKDNVLLQVDVSSLMMD